MRILIVKIGAIGDVVMALPLLPFIKRKHPDCHITWIAGQIVTPILIQTGLVDEIIEVAESKLLKGSPIEKIRAIGKVWKQVAFKSFDIVLYYYYSDAYKILTLPARVKETRRFTRNPEKRVSPIPGRHHSFEYIQTFDKSEGSHQFDLKFPGLSSIDTEHQAILDRFRTKKRIILSCGGAKNILREDDLRRWPIDRYVTLSQKLIEIGCEIFLTGSQSDEWVLTHFKELPIHSFIGKIPLASFVSFLKIGDLMVTHDSGPLHLADLARIPSVGLFGPTPPFSFKSLHPDSETIWGGESLSCRPCYDGKEYANCKRAHCMEDISVNSVFEKIRNMLEKSSVKPQFQ